MQGPDAVGTEGIEWVLAKLPLGDGLRGDGKAENLSLAEGIGFLDGEDKGIGGLGDTKGVLCFSQLVLATCFENAHVFVLTDFVAENGSHVSIDEEGNVGGAGLGECDFDFAVNGVFGSCLSVYIVGVDNRQAFGVWHTEGEYRGDSLTEERIVFGHQGLCDGVAGPGEVVLALDDGFGSIQGDF